MTDQSTSNAARENEATLNGYWSRAVEALVESGVPWPDAAKSMLSIAALQVEAALGTDVAERSLTAAAEYIADRKQHRH